MMSELRSPNAQSMMRSGVAARIAGLAALLVFASHPLMAQSQEEESAGSLEEVIVTAQKREQSLQSVPISISAFSEEEMRKADIFSLAGIADRTPNFSMGSLNKGQPQVFIRGIGSNDDGAGSDPSVVMFIDEVYIGRPAAQVFDLFDLERVEVLRGPQGTLFGKNAVGGAVSLYSRKPDERFVGRAEATVGNFNNVVLRGLVSGPLSDTVFGSISASSRQRDGYVESVFTGDELSDQDSGNVRAALRFVPNDDLDILISADYGRSRENGMGRILYGPGQLYSAAVAFMPEAVGDFRKTFQNEPGRNDTDIWGISGTVNWNVGMGTLTSITAFRGAELDVLDDFTGWGGAPIDANNYIVEDSNQFSQELRYSGMAFEDRMSFVVGAYYYEEDVDRFESSALAFGGAPINPAILAPGWDMFNTTQSASVFGDVTYYFTTAFSLTAGARYTDESKDSRILGYASVPIPITIAQDFDVSTSKSWSAFTPRLVLNYQWNDNLFLYASMSEGFKSGGFPGTPADPVAAGTPFDQEEATAYEIGFKSELLDKRLRLNVSAFTTDYTDLQVLQRKVRFEGDLGVIVTENAADATSQGVEAEFVALLTEGLEISGSYGYLDATYDRYLEPNGINNAGNYLRNAPKNSWNVAATYTHDLSGGADVEFRFEYLSQDRSFQDPRNVLAASKPAYSVANARVAYTPANARWELALWAKNLFDEEYLSHNWPFDPFAGGVGAPAEPRMYGVTATWNFGE